MSTREHVLTGLLRADGIALAVARGVFEEAGGGEAGSLALRRYLDTELRAMTRWPADQDYARIADDFERAGYGAGAEILRQASMAGPMLAEKEAAWKQRYAGRPPLSGEVLTDALLREPEMASWDPCGPYIGVDGAEYAAGGMDLEGGTVPIMVVTSRGTRETITGWRSFDDMQAWIAGRGTGGSRGLQPPPVAAVPRTWLEDAVLARIASSPQDAAEAISLLAPDAMTTDVRYELYEAIRTLSRRGGGGYTPETIIAEAVSRLACVPAEALGRYGGGSGSLMRTYVARLAETEVGDTEFLEAAENLHLEDHQARERAAFRVAAAGPQTQRQLDGPVAGTTVAPGPCPDLPPGHGPGPHDLEPDGPVQGR